MDFKATWQDFERKRWRPFLEKWKQVVLFPKLFFTEWDHKEPWKEVITFNVMCGLVAGIMKTVLTFGGGVLSIILYPIIFLISTVVGGAALFVSLKLFAGEGEFEQTIKAVGYTQGVAVISFGLPAVGLLFGFYHLFLLAVVGKMIHQLDIRSAFLGVLIPIILYLVLVTLFATILGVRFFGGILSHEGQGL